MDKKRVLIACGAGIATSTVVCDKVEKLLKAHDIPAEIIQCKIAEVAAKAKDADLIISTTILPTTYEIPAIKATAYVTGIAMEKLDAQILDFFK